MAFAAVEPVVHGNNLYGRGACDDKGQMFAHVKALEAYLRTERVLPVNVKCLFEGEEEIGSPKLTPFLSQHKSAFAADVVVISDMPIVVPDRPAITYAMRGGLSLELDTNFMAKPTLVDRRHPGMRAAQVAYRKGFGAMPVFLRSGGTIPIVNTFQAMLGIPIVLMGFALPDDRMHAPNEKFHLPNLYHGIATSIWFLAEIGMRAGLQSRPTRKRAAPPAAMA
jgi:acetylornithine deacetylase/succinyl-diaminopimelate desuccinylase-like protein